MSDVVRCNTCGTEWPRDPALEVACPKCAAPVGVRCQRPSGHRGPLIPFHQARLQRALDEGYEQPCPGAKRPTTATRVAPPARKQRRATTPATVAASLWEVA